MRSLPNELANKKAKLVVELGESKQKIVSAIDDINKKWKEDWDNVIALQNQYNDVVREANEFREQVGSLQQEYMDGKTEKWQESDAGQIYQEWITAWEEDLPELDLSEFETIDAPEFVAPESLEDLSNEYQ